MSLSEFYDNLFGLQDDLQIETLASMAQSFTSLRDINPYTFVFNRFVQDNKGNEGLDEIGDTSEGEGEIITPFPPEDYRKVSRGEESTSVILHQEGSNLKSFAPPLLRSFLQNEISPDVLPTVLLSTESDLSSVAANLQAVGSNLSLVLTNSQPAELNELAASEKVLTALPFVELNSSPGLQGLEEPLQMPYSAPVFDSIDIRSNANTQGSLFISNNESRRTVELPFIKETGRIKQSFSFGEDESVDSSQLTVNSQVSVADKVADKTETSASISIEAISEAAALRAIAIIEESLVQELEGRLA